MARHDDATFVLSEGRFYKAAVGAAFPTNPLSPDTLVWSEIGHTSLEDVFAQESEGGETTTLGTLQAKTLRTKRTTVVETFKFTIQQWDKDSLKLFYGSNMVDINSDGSLMGVHQTPTATSAAFLAVFIDGSQTFSFYAPKAEIFRGDNMSITDTESLAGLPLAVTPLIHSTNVWPYAVTPLETA